MFYTICDQIFAENCVVEGAGHRRGDEEDRI
jgi:hypothetical protein